MTSTLNDSSVHRRAYDAHKEFTNKILIGVGIILFSSSLLGLFKLNTTVNLLQLNYKHSTASILKLETALNNFTRAGERFTRTDGKTLREYIDIQINVIQKQVEDLQNQMTNYCQETLSRPNE